MEVLLAARPRDLGVSAAPSLSQYQSTAAGAASEESKLLELNRATVSFSFADLYKSLSITAKEAVERMNEFIAKNAGAAAQVPNKDALSAESAADSIVSGVVEAYQAYKQNNNFIVSDEQRAQFTDLARRGLEAGFKKAEEILSTLGAFEKTEIRDAFDQTVQKTEDKLVAFSQFSEDSDR